MINVSPVSNEFIRLSKTLFTLILLFLFSTVSHAKDVKHLLSLNEAIERTKKHKNYIAGVKLYVNSQETPVVERLYLQVVSKKTSVAFLQSDSDVCQNAFKNTIVAMQKQAQKIGAIAVVNIHSKFAGKTLDDNKKYQCVVGNLVGEVTLVGELVRFRDM